MSYHTSTVTVPVTLVCKIEKNKRLCREKYDTITRRKSRVLLPFTESTLEMESDLAKFAS